MTRRGRFGGLLALLLALVATAADAARPPGWDPARFMDVDEIRPGMTGVGRSVFVGADVREFGVEILGVIPTADPRNRMILARLSGEGLEESGVIAGMSGSPITIDGRLIGALAFGWPYATQPITGITPIADMLALQERAGADPGGGTARRMSPELWRRLWEGTPQEALELLAPAPEPAAGTLPPLRVPVAVSGIGGAARTEAARVLESCGFRMEQGAVLGSDPSFVGGPLGPGSALGVELVRGDAQIAAIGTVTWTEGNRVFAFGHPMMNRGASAYPMSAASIVTVMPRLTSSFKMGVVGGSLGAVTRDYSKGIVGELGEAPRMIPMTVDLRLGDRRETLRFELLDAEALTPALAGVVASNAVETLGRETGGSTVAVTTRLDLADGRGVTAHDVDAGFAPAMSVAGSVARLVGLVHGNPFEVVRVAAISVTASVDDTVGAAFLEGLSLPPGPHEPGDALPLEAALRDYRGARWTRRLEFALPDNLAPGTYSLLACDAQQDAAAEAQRAPGRFDPENLDQLLAMLGDELPRDRLVLRLLGAGGDPVIRGRELPNLPPSLRRALVTPFASGRVTQTGSSVERVQHEEMGRMVIGCQTLSLTVEAAR